MFNEKNRNAIKIFLLSSTLVIISFLLEYNIGLNLADEGYLWYGAIQTVLGDVPIRDFQAYDPGRYYWSAFWMLLFGKGIISLRISLAIFQAIGLTLGLMALSRVIHSWPALSVAGLILIMWMIPRHKIFESSLAMMSVYFALRLIENPSLSRYLISGLFVGISAVFGRNHGLYNLLAFSLLMLFVRFRLKKTGLIKNIGVFIGGVLLGYSPMLLMMLMVSGFFDSFFAPLALILRRGTTNMPLPIPWPWKYHYSQMPVFMAMDRLSTGSFFLLLPLFNIFAITYSLTSKKENFKRKYLLLASGTVGVMYMHYAFARSDVGHLGQGITPMVIGVLTIPYVFNINRKRVFCSAGFVILLIMTFFSAGTQSESFRKAALGPRVFVKCDIAGDNLWIHFMTARYIETVKQINSQLILPEEGLLVVPWQPGVYSILQRKSPLWELWFVDPQPETRQTEMIKQLEQERVNWIFLDNVGLDERDELRFSNTHKLLWEYFQGNYETVAVQGLHVEERLLRRKSKE